MVCLLCLGATSFAQGAMTDEDVLEYVKQAASEGRSQNEIVRALSLRGVDAEQVRRVERLYREQQDSDNVAETATSRGHYTYANEEVPETATSYQDEDLGEALAVYGRDVFRNRNLNFAPSENLATPKNYRLGPGDEVIIEIYGSNQKTIRGTISPEGSINTEYLGPIYLNGMTIDEANSYLRRRLGQVYGGLLNNESDLRLSLGQIRTIQVNILGDVHNPGTFHLSSFSTVFHALYRAGGIVEPGSLRDISVVRNGKTVATVDVYDFLTNGNRSSDIRLEEGDVILVRPYKIMVKADGKLKRPMYFEMKPGETFTDLLNYAGGFANSAYTESITVTRQNGKSYEVRTVYESEYDSFKLQNGDEIQVGELTSLFENKLTIVGSVYRPSVYELGDKVHTVRQLVEAAGGVLPDAFLGRAVLHRQHPDKTMEVISVNLEDVLSGKTDIALQNNDELHITSQYDLNDKGNVTIQGMVTNPGTYPFAENTTVEDLIILAGGLRRGASVSRVDVSRRLEDDGSSTIKAELSELFSFPIKDGLVDDGEGGFVLQPYDEVYVHRSPSYVSQQHFSVEGEVNFPGTFSMNGREDRLSDLVDLAGGVTSFAYLEGARLYRQSSRAELRQSHDARMALYAVGDPEVSVSIAQDYQVAINLVEALKNPGGEYDVILKEGDRLVIPTRTSTVRVTGGVMVPNVLTFNPKMSAADYVANCGGYVPRAKRTRAYIISLNGNVKRMRSWSKVTPGAEIVVPLKEVKERQDTNIMGYATTAASLGTMAASIATLISRLK